MIKNNFLAISSPSIQRWLHWAVYLILILPIIVLPPTFRPSSWTRTSLFKIILTCLAAFLWYRFFYRKNLSFSVFTKKNPAFLPAAALTVFVGLVCVSTLFSADISFSLFGSPGRSGGVINYLYYVLFAAILFIGIQADSWKKLLKINLIGGAIASLFGLIQYFGFFETVFVPFSAGGPGTPSFLGNSTLLAMYMIFMAWSAFTFFINEQQRNVKYGYGALALLFTFTILITSSRAAYLAMTLAALFYLLWYPKKLKAFKLIAIAIIATGIIIVAIANLFPHIGAYHTLLKTATTRLSIGNIVKDLTGNRLPAWNMTAKAIADRPLFGWGAENFYIGFEQYYMPINESLQKEWWDRPHNIFLDIAVHYGIPALLAWTAFWVLLFWRLERYKRNETDLSRQHWAQGIQAMLIAYGIVLFFNFDEFPTYIIAFFFVALAFHLISSQGPTKEILPPNSIASKPAAAYALALLAIAFVGYVGIWPLFLNESIIHADTLVMQQQCDKAIALSESTWRKPSIVKTYASLSYADFIKRCALSNPEKEGEYAQTAMDALVPAAVAQPKYSRTWISMGGFSNVLAARQEDQAKQKALLAEAKTYLQKALALSPRRVEVLTEMAINAMVSKDYPEMVRISQQCIQVSERYGACNWYLGIAQIFMGNIGEGEKNIAISKEKGYGDPALLQLAVAYLSQKDYPRAFAVYEQLTERYHEHPGFHGVAAALAKELGNYPAATKHALEVFRIQPDNPESVQFLESLFALRPNDPAMESTLYSLAYIYGELGKRQKSVALLTKSRDFYLQVIARTPSNAEYHWGLANIYNLLNEPYKARLEAMLAAKANPTYRKGVQEFLNKLPIEEDLKRLP